MCNDLRSRSATPESPNCYLSLVYEGVDRAKGALGEPLTRHACKSLLSLSSVCLYSVKVQRERATDKHPKRAENQAREDA